MKVKALILITLLNFISLFGQKQPIYPNPEKGFKKVEIKLPKLVNEDSYRLEINFTMESESKECTKQIFGFKDIETRFAEPSGAYPYYVINANAIDIIDINIPDCTSNKKIKKKIYSDKRLFEDYSSSFISRFYIPENWNVEYRIWKPISDYEKAK